MPEFQNVRHVKHSQKARICDECGHAINIGDPYMYWAAKHEGIFQEGAGHEECVAWADAVMNSDEGRGALRDSDPRDEDLEDLIGAVKANPPSALMRSRLNADWIAAVDTILRGPAVHPGWELPEGAAAVFQRQKTWKFEYKRFRQSWRLLPQWRSWAGGGWSIVWLAWEWGRM